MSSIKEVTAGKNKDKWINLDVFTVTTTYDPKITDTGKSHRTFVITDDDAGCRLTLWGKASKLPLVVGESFCLKGILLTNVWDNEVSISAESVTLADAKGKPIKTSEIVPETSDLTSGQLVRIEALKASVACYVSLGVKDIENEVTAIRDTASKFEDYLLTGNLPF